jgi:SAM-dependent methyltransferase
VTDDADVWEAIGSAWTPGRGTAALRAYSDRVNLALLERWLPERIGSVLKTDLFDEAVGHGLVGSLGARAERIVGIDISASVVREAARRNPSLEAVVADVRALPFPAGSFDVVVSNSTLDHFDSEAAIDEALAELARVLRPGGVLVVTLDNPANPVVWLRNHVPERVLRSTGLVPYPVGATLGPRALAQAVTRAGLAVEDAAVVAHVPRLLVRGFGLRSRRLLAAERAGALPTRTLTGQFGAVLARRPVAGPAGVRHAAPRPRNVTLERVLSATVLRRLTLLALDLDRRAEPREPTLPVAFGFLGPDDAGALEELRSGLGGVALERFARGDRCFAARTADRRVVSVRWVARGRAPIEFLGFTLELAGEEAYNFDTWSDPSVRGHGVASATGAHLNDALAREGVRTVLRAVWPANAEGLRNAAREGFTPVGIVASVRLGPVRRRIVRRRSSPG